MSSAGCSSAPAPQGHIEGHIEAIRNHGGGACDGCGNSKAGQAAAIPAPSTCRPESGGAGAAWRGPGTLTVR